MDKKIEGSAIEKGIFVPLSSLFSLFKGRPLFLSLVKSSALSTFWFGDVPFFER